MIERGVFYRAAGASAMLLLACTAGSCDSQKKATPPAATRVPVAPARPTLEQPSLADTKPADLAGLHNVVAYHEGYLSGSVPEGDAGFDTLAAMGIRTVISVDGAEPDVAKAKARGMRYIHLPIGYNGFDEARKLELVRATRDAMQDGPVYIHCHHGKHRSAGAAAAVAVSMGWLKNDEAVGRMKVSGTAPGYKGLYACATESQVLGANVIDAVPANFPEVSRPAGFVKAMVEMDERFEHLKLIEKAGWKAPKDHPDLVPVAEAAMMADAFRDLEHGEYAKRKNAEFMKLLDTNWKQSQALEDMLAAGETDGTKLSKLFAAIGATCKDCHVKYRD